MNKKLAMLMFAIGLGAAAAPALASCQYYCAVEHRACLASSTNPAEECEPEYEACVDACGG